MRVAAYPTYKPSGIDWLGAVPAHWGVDRIKWTTTGTVNGIWGDEPNEIDDLICVRVADFDRQGFRVVDEPPTLRAVDRAQRRGRLLKKGDLLIEKSGGGERQLVGCVVYFDHDFEAVCSNFVARMPIVGTHSPRYWAYAHASMYSGRVNYPAIKQTTGIQNLDSAAYLDSRVGFPPKEEQELIAVFLDRETAKIDALVSKKHKLIERLNEKRAALISRTVTRGLPPAAARAAGLDPHPKLKPSGLAWLEAIPEHWKVNRLATATTMITNGFVGPTRDILVDDGIRYLQSLHIKGNRIIFDTQYFVEQEWSREHGRSVLRRGDVLIVQTGDIGQVAVVPPEFEGCNCHALIIARPRPGTLSGDFLAFFLNSSFGFDELKRVETGALHPHLNCGFVRDIRFPLPPSREQEAIASYLKRETSVLDALVQAIETARDRLLEYRTALISAAVTGKIDVRGTAAAEPPAGSTLPS